MNRYSIQFIATPSKGVQRTWSLMNCCDQVALEDRCKKIRQLIYVIAGPSSAVITELSNLETILQLCNPRWQRSINISEIRTYTLFTSRVENTALITMKTQGRKVHTIGVSNTSSMDQYDNVIRLMGIFMRVIEGNNSPNLQWLRDMSIGKVNSYQDDADKMTLYQQFNLIARLHNTQYFSLESHPPEISIAVAPSSYEIVITKE